MFDFPKYVDQSTKAEFVNTATVTPLQLTEQLHTSLESFETHESSS